MSSHLLDERIVREFIAHGYTLVQADQPPDFHRQVSEKLDAILAAEGNPGNNILPRVPELGAIFDSPTVRGALQSLLGPGYSMHSHRYCHLNSPGSQGQHWHKDDYIFDHNVRHHRFRWVMAFYYPQDVDPDMGPTGIASDHHYCNHISNADPTLSSEEEIKLCGPAGTVALVNFDVWHRATANISNRKRYMLKFQFLRMHEPCEPSWQDSGGDGQPIADDPHPNLSAHVWHWLSGNPDAAPHLQALDKENFATASQCNNEHSRIDNAYIPHDQGAQAIPDLIDALRIEARSKADSNQAPTPANVQGGNPADLETAHVLVALGRAAVPALIDELSNADWAPRTAAAAILGNIGHEAHDSAPALNCALSDASHWVRRNAAEALGTIAPQNGVSSSSLARALSDSYEPVRRNAALSLAKIGTADDDAIRALQKSLGDENRYVRFNALLALQRIGTPAALDALWSDIHNARWCPVTTRETPY